MKLLLFSYRLILILLFMEIGIRLPNAKIRNEPCNDFAARLKFICQEVHFTKMEQPRMPPCIFWRNATDS